MVNSNKGNNMVAMNKSECVRQALAELGYDAKPADVRDYLGKRFKLNIDSKYLSVAMFNARKAKNGPSAASRKGKTAPKVVPQGGSILDMAKESEDLAASLSMVRRLKGIDLNEAERVLEQICKTQEIIGDKDKAIEAFELLSR